MENFKTALDWMLSERELTQVELAQRSGVAIGSIRNAMRGIAGVKVHREIAAFFEFSSVADMLRYTAARRLEQDLSGNEMVTAPGSPQRAEGLAYWKAQKKSILERIKGLADEAKGADEKTAKQLEKHQKWWGAKLDLVEQKISGWAPVPRPRMASTGPAVDADTMQAVARLAKDTGNTPDELLKKLVFWLEKQDKAVRQWIAGDPDFTHLFHEPAIRSMQGKKS